MYDSASLKPSNGRKKIRVSSGTFTFLTGNAFLTGNVTFLAGTSRFSTGNGTFSTGNVAAVSVDETIEDTSEIIYITCWQLNKENTCNY